MMSSDLTSIDATNILLIKTSSLGDVVQSLPVLTALRSRFPRAKITWLVSPPCHQVIDGHPDLDEILLFDRNRYRGWRRAAIAPFGFAALCASLFRRRFDLVVDLHGLLRSGLMTGATRATTRVGLATAREGAARFYTHAVPVPTLDMSAVDRYWLVCAALGAAGSDKRFHVPVPAADDQWAADQLGARPRPWLAVNPGARWLTKRWTPEKFATVADRFVERTGGSIVLTGSPDERDVAGAVRAALRSEALDLVGRTSVKQLAAVLRRADLMLTGDTGPMHLAAALGTPIVSIFTCTSPIRARPYSPSAVIVQTGVACAGSYVRQCPHLSCMNEVTVERVWAAVQRQLDAISDRVDPAGAARG